MWNEHYKRKVPQLSRPVVHLSVLLFPKILNRITNVIKDILERKEGRRDVSRWMAQFECCMKKAVPIGNSFATVQWKSLA